MYYIVSPLDYTPDEPSSGVGEVELMLLMNGRFERWINRWKRIEAMRAGKVTFQSEVGA